MSSTTTLRRIGKRVASSFLLVFFAATAAGPSGAAAAPTPGQLQFQATTLDGRPFNGPDYTGKPVVVWYWAPWCPECMQEAPNVVRAAAANPQVSFIAISGKPITSTGKALEQTRAFVGKYGLGAVPQVADLKGEAFLRSNVTVMPTFVFLKPSGESSSLVGVVPEKTLSDRAQQTLR